MAEFILVHGGLHGAWCWELLEAELGRLGHTSFAMDLPIDQANVWIDDYADTVLAAVAGKAADDAYLVGHSMGGMIVPRVAHRRPSSRIIFLCAGFADTSEEEHRETLAAIDPTYWATIQPDDNGFVGVSRDTAIHGFYHDVAPDLADWAIARLRPQWSEAYTDIPPIAPYADKVAHVIHCTDDHILRAAPHREIAHKRFGITPIELPGSHSPFLSRPRALAEALDGIARPTGVDQAEPNR